MDLNNYTCEGRIPFSVSVYTKSIELGYEYATYFTTEFYNNQCEYLEDVEADDDAILVLLF